MQCRGAGLDVRGRRGDRGSCVGDGDHFAEPHGDCVRVLRRDGDAECLGDCDIHECTEVRGSQAQAAPTRRPDGMPGDRSVGKVRRPGTPGASTAPQEPQPPTALAPAALSGRVAYRDGTAVRIVRMERGAQTAQGPGAFPGSGFVAVDLEVSAGSRPLDLSRVVVTALAGDPQVVVGPVYVPEAKTRDFTGRLAASPAGAAAKATARYAFAVPTQATQLRLVVDLDDAHGNAVFAGPLA